MKRYAHALFLLFFFFSFFFVNGYSVTYQLLQTELQTMRDLSQSLPTSSSGKNWNTSDQNPCLWHGVACSNSPSSSNVTGLDLSGLGLSTSSTNISSAQPFFDTLCRLNSLESLDLSLNSFTFIPDSFFANCDGLSGLRSLNLSSNGLSGPVGNFSSFSELESLDLSFNRLIGAVSSQLEGLIRLKSLNLSCNFLNGAITVPGEASGLEELVLSFNNFSGPIPDGTFSYGNLTLLDLRQNHLHGPVPNGIGGLAKLEILLLSSNSLTGELPGSLSSIANLTRFAANLNGFTGSIPAGLTRNMHVLDLSYNHLSGEIPSDLLSAPTLESVDLTSNQLQGPIPGNLSQSLYRLRLGSNSLNGSIPPAIQSLTRLVYLELDNNALDGEIPPQLENCRNLTLLNLASNQLQGGLPKELGNLDQLVIMKFQENNLIGEIPSEFSKLLNVSTLNLSHNSLSGEIPYTIYSLQKLSVLNLEDNNLSGPIPSTIGDLGSLIELQLGNNQLNGTVPRMPSSLSSALNLSSNLLSGHIPSSLADLTQLEILDLSNNLFTGEIPLFLTQIQSLTQLVLSNNQLSGTLPHFPSYVKVNVTGNKDLVTQPLLPASTSRKKSSTVWIIIVAIIGAVVGLGLVIVVFVVATSKRFYQVEDEGLQSEDSPPQIVDGCFITSDSMHLSNIDFTKAMEAVSNPNNITLKTRFSTYYKAAMPNGVSYSVKKLNWSEKIFQMGSHERFGQELEVLGRLSNSNVMVPLAYVLTEDSAYLFYEHVHKGTVYDFLHKGSESALDWPSRYSIALGVAQGLTFLHGCIQPVLLLDLSTRSIHLKSMKEPQIGDIELCKVIDPTKSTGSLSTVAGSVGYIPPEYAYTMRITMAGNVYSFGIMLLELLTGKPPVSGGVELAKWALSSSARLDKREQILDPSICNTSLAVRSQMLSVLKVALSCVNSSPDARPKMRNVLRMLFNAK